MTRLVSQHHWFWDQGMVASTLCFYQPIMLHLLSYLQLHFELSWAAWGLRRSYTLPKRLFYVMIDQQQGECWQWEQSEIPKEVLWVRSKQKPHILTKSGYHQLCNWRVMHESLRSTAEEGGHFAWLAVCVASINNPGLNNGSVINLMTKLSWFSHHLFCIITVAFTWHRVI